MSTISIIIPCYNQANYLPETLDSVFAQTFQDWECIIVNDGSPDNTEEVATAYCEKDSRFKYVYKDNGGLADARNYGIKASNGEFILPLDSDDKIAPTYIEKAIRHFELHPETTLVYCKADRFDEKNGPWNLPEYKYDNLLWDNCIFCSSIYKRRDYDVAGGYNTNMKYGLEDWDFWLSLLNPNSVVYCIDEFLFHYRYRKGSMISGVNAERQKEMNRQIFRNHRAVYANEVENLINYHYQSKVAESYRKDFEIAINSRSYRLGYCLLSPFMWVRTLVVKLKEIFEG